MSDEVAEIALHKEWLAKLAETLDPLQRLDKVKVAYTPIDLGVKMCDRIPVKLLSKPILVVSDIGLLCALIRSMRKRGVTVFTNVHFLCHVKKHAEFAENQLRIETVFVPYSEFERFLGKDGFASYFHDVKFDVIVGNPPFQPEVKDGGGSGSANKIWQKFVEMAFELTNDEGHILFVTPNNWRAGNFTKSVVKEAQRLMWEEATILWYEDAKEHFSEISKGSSITFDAWHVRKGQHETTIPQRELAAAMVLPRSETAVSIFAKFFNKCVMSEPIQRVKDHDGRDAALQRSITHPYKHVNTSAWTRANKFQWFEEKTDGFDDNKVLISNSGKPTPTYSPAGECGTGSHTSGYRVKNEDAGKQLVNFLESPLVKFIVNEMNSRKDPIGFPVYLFFRLPQALTSLSWQQVFGFTDDELSIIEGRSPVSIKEAAE